MSWVATTSWSRYAGRSAESRGLAHFLFKIFSQGHSLPLSEEPQERPAPSPRVALNLATLNLATLNLATLTEADLCEANLTGANLAGANLAGADLKDTDLEDVRGFEFSEVQMRAVARRPDGTASRLTGPADPDGQT